MLFRASLLLLCALDGGGKPKMIPCAPNTRLRATGFNVCPARFQYCFGLATSPLLE